ncbi:hypothetical protein [Bradyrhizobium sp. ERR14]|uniref:hypothetical protein n=1 Tax=Bradyrhizobium sp. ERR14 TaxID=2663837 RepID=UPI00161B9AD5|nr:hypothetical protein [Bradyrhizobium sp. ERR14]MBB4393433.1 hypothetical protein [Bradyrhizobium sp. ERR14]
MISQTLRSTFVWLWRELPVPVIAAVRAGRRHVFARAELFAEDEGGELSLVATGETLLVPTGQRSSRIDDDPAG